MNTITVRQLLREFKSLFPLPSEGLEVIRKEGNFFITPFNPSVPGNLETKPLPETKEEIIEVPVEVTQEVPVHTVGWCQMHFEKGKNYRLFKMTWEDENGTPVVDKKWACPRCIEHYTTIGRGRVSFEMEPNKDVSSAPAF